MATISQGIYEIADAINGSRVQRKGNNISAAIDVLNDVCAGSDQPRANDIYSALRLLKSYIGKKGAADAVLGTKSITANDTYLASADELDGYSSVTVNVPNPSTGTLSITENGEGIDVTQYAAVDVAVPGPSFGGLGYVTSTDQTPTVGYPLHNPQDDYIFAALVGDDIVASDGLGAPAFAAGLRLQTIEVSADMCDVWTVTLSEGTDNIATAQKVADSYGEDPDVTRTAVDDKYVYTFTMPETTEGQFVVIFPWST